MLAVATTQSYGDMSIPMYFQNHFATLGISYNIDIFGAVYIKKPGCQTEEVQTRFFANPNLVSYRVHRVALRQSPECEVVVAPVR